MYSLKLIDGNKFENTFMSTFSFGAGQALKRRQSDVRLMLSGKRMLENIQTLNNVAR